ncbi:MAG: (Fe-S)-binding protein [Thermodesulfobacteriota bacterium]
MDRERLKAELEKCVRCGRCLGVCPVYRQTLWEGSVARGKLSWLRAELGGEADLAGRMKDLLSHCLLCGACAEGCASGVEGDELIRAGRALALGDRGLDGLRGLLARDLLARGAVARGLWRGRALFLRNVPEESGLHFRFPLNKLGAGRWLPRPAGRSFLEGQAARSSSRAGGPRVALFVGCVSNYLRPAAAEAARRLLEAAGARVVVPMAQVCCGKPAAGAGDEKTALYLARKNIQALDPAGFDFVAAPCATCSEQLKAYAFAGGADLAARVRDLSELLAGELGWQPEPGPAKDKRESLRVFYHDPCHLRRKQGVHREPRVLLAALPGVTLVGPDEPPVCCGYGGLFNLWHYALSRELFQTRIESIRPHHPDLVVTSCSGCWLQFKDGLDRLQQPFAVGFLAELLAERGLSAAADGTGSVGKDLPERTDGRP